LDMELDFDSDLFSRTLKYLGPPAPSCPKCQKDLDRIEVERYAETIHWDKDIGAYEFSKRIPAAEYICPYCKEKIGGRFGNDTKWGFDPIRANVIGHTKLEEGKQMLEKFGDNISKKKSQTLTTPYG